MKNLIFDIEADGLTPSKIWCIVAKDLDSNTVYEYGPDKLEEGIELLRNAKTLVGHNIIGYDIPVIEKLHKVKLTDNVIDTLVLSRLFQPVRENGHSLRTWGYRIGVHKQVQPDDFDCYTPEMLSYCRQDVLLNEQVYLKLLEEGRGFNQESIDLETNVAKIMHEQEQTGFLFDIERASMLLAKLKTRMVEVEDEVQRTFKPKWVDDKLVTPYIKKNGELSKRGLTDEEYDNCIKTQNVKPFMRKKLQEFNLGSRKQIGEYLVDFGWKPERFTPTCQPIVDELSLIHI